MNDAYEHRADVDWPTPPPEEQPMPDPFAVARAVHRAGYVEFDELGFLYVWKRGLTINVYDAVTGQTVDMWMLEGTGAEPPEELREAAIASIAEHRLEVGNGRTDR